MMQVLGETLLTGATVPGPWFERFGDAATFACEVFVLGQDVRMEITVETKNTEDPDSAAVSVPPVGPQSGPWAVDSAGVSKQAYSGFKELVRFVYEVAYEGDSPPPTPGVVHFRMLPPMWEDNMVPPDADFQVVQGDQLPATPSVLSFIPFYP